MGIKIYGDLPICAICNKPIDRIITWYDHKRHETVYQVECHQQNREYRVEDFELMNTKILVVDRVFVEEAEMEVKVKQYLDTN